MKPFFENPIGSFALLVSLISFIFNFIYTRRKFVASHVPVIGFNGKISKPKEYSDVYSNPGTDVSFKVTNLSDNVGIINILMSIQISVSNSIFDLLKYNWQEYALYKCNRLEKGESEETLPLLKWDDNPKHSISSEGGYTIEYCLMKTFSSYLTRKWRMTNGFRMAVFVLNENKPILIRFSVTYQSGIHGSRVFKKIFVLRLIPIVEYIEEFGNVILGWKTTKHTDFIEFN